MKLADVVKPVGLLHEKLSQQTIQEQRDAALGQQASAQTPDQLDAATRLADRKAGELYVRRAFSVITMPLDFVAGTGRDRREYRRKPSVGEAFSDLGKHPCDTGMLPLAASFGAAGVALAGLAGGAVVGYPLGVLTGSPGRGALFGMKVIGYPVAYAVGGLTWVLANAAALPSAGIKALGKGIGAVGGAAYGAVHGPHGARHFQAPPARPLNPVAIPTA